MVSAVVVVVSCGKGLNRGQCEEGEPDLDQSKDCAALHAVRPMHNPTKGQDGLHITSREQLVRLVEYAAQLCNRLSTNWLWPGLSRCRVLCAPLLPSLSFFESRARLVCSMSGAMPWGGEMVAADTIQYAAAP